jgi:AcrR family transcriptional regulator
MSSGNPVFAGHRKGGKFLQEKRKADRASRQDNCEDMAMSPVAVRDNQPWKGFAIRQRTPELKREVLLKTAAHLFLERGFRKTAMNDIADRLKITKPAVYHYFKNKEEILVGCYEYGIDATDWDKGSGLDKTRSFIRAFVEGVVTMDFGRCVATLDDGDLSLSARAKVRKLKRRMASQLRGFIEEGIADGTIAPCNSMLVSFAIGGAINSIGVWYHPSGRLAPRDIVESFTEYLVSGFVGPEARDRNHTAGGLKRRSNGAGPANKFKVAAK